MWVTKFTTGQMLQPSEYASALGCICKPSWGGHKSRFHCCVTVPLKPSRCDQARPAQPSPSGRIHPSHAASALQLPTASASSRGAPTGGLQLPAGPAACRRCAPSRRCWAARPPGPPAGGLHLPAGRAAAAPPFPAAAAASLARQRRRRAGAGLARRHGGGCPERGKRGLLGPAVEGSETGEVSRQSAPCWTCGKCGSWWTRRKYGAARADVVGGWGWLGRGPSTGPVFPPPHSQHGRCPSPCWGGCLTPTSCPADPLLFHASVPASLVTVQCGPVRLV